MANDGTVKIGVDFEVDKKTLKNLDGEVSAALDKSAVSMEKMKASLGNISGVAKTTLSGLGSFATSIASMTVKSVTAASTAVGGLIAYGAKYNAEIEQYRTSFEVMTGSAEKAVEISERLVQIGAETPFETENLAEVTQLLINYGLTADEAIDKMMMLGDISQGNSEKMKRIAVAYGQMSSAGKVQLVDIKQMIEAGFNPLQEISESTGESMESLYSRISEGAISVDEITASMQRSTAQGGKYFQSMEKQSKTASGQISTLKDNFAQLAGVIAGDTSSSLTAEMLPMLNNMLAEMQEAFETGGFEGISLAFGENLAQILTMGAEKLPEIMNMGGDIIAAISQGLKNNSDEISNALLAVLLALPDFIIDNFETLLDIGSVFIENLTNGIIENSDDLSESAVEFVSLFADFIIDNAPLIGKAAKELIISLADAIGKEVPALKPFTDIIKSLAENLKPIAEALIPVIAGIEGFKALQSVVGIVSGIASGFSAMASGAGLLKGALTLLGGPAAAAITLVGGLATALAVDYAMDASKLQQIIDETTRAAKDMSEQIDTNVDTMAEYKTSADAQIEADKAMIDQTQRLYTELQTLVDENGVVKAGYEDRVSYITGELEKATGIEIDLIDGQIQKYGELKEKIKDVILEQRAQSMQSAYSTVYETALQQNATAVRDYSDTQDRLNEYQAYIDSIYTDVQTQLAEAGEIDEFIKLGALTEGNLSNWKYVLSDEEEAKLTGIFEAQKVDLQNLEKLKGAYAQNQHDIEQYEKATEAMYAGNYSLAQTYYAQIGNLSYENLATVEDTLDEQVESVNKAVDEAMKDYTSGVALGNKTAEADFVSAMTRIAEDAKNGGISAGTLFSTNFVNELAAVDSNALLKIATDLGFDWGELFGMTSAQAAKDALINNMQWLYSVNELIPKTINSASDAAMYQAGTYEITNNIYTTSSAEKTAEETTKLQTNDTYGKGQ